MFSIQIISKETRKEYTLDLQRATGEEAVLCPVCSQDRKKSKIKCLGWNHTKGIGACNHCGTAFYNKDNKMKIAEKTYTVPIENLTELNDKAITWFESRAISKATIMRFKLSGNMVFMPQIQKEVYCIHFNYYLNGGLVNVKYRDSQKNFKLSAGAKLIFYNLDAVVDSETVTIVEGEIDCLSMYEAGIYDCVSVPNGASKGNQRLEYLDNCCEYFENKKTIIIATDNDDAGIALRNELSRRLGKERCKIMPFVEGCKDANDVLVNHGAEKLKECWDSSYEFPLEGIRTVVDFDDAINDLYVNGFPTGTKVGFENLDNHIKFSPGQVTGITGIPNSGKSEFADQIIIKLAQQGWKIGLFSAENQPEHYHFSKLSEKYIGKSFQSANEYYRMSVDELMKAKEFINEHFSFVELKEENTTVEGMIGKMTELVNRKGINLFLIDPWNYLEHKQKAGQTETQYIGESLTKFCNSAKRLNIHIIIVAHPVKIQKEKDTGKFKVATLYDIAGSANWFNKLDNGISVYRDFEKDQVDVHIQKIRFKWCGKIGTVSFKWNYFNGQYTEINEGFAV